MPKLDRDTRVLAIQYVRRYDKYRARLAAEREAILHRSPAPPDGQPRGNATGDPTVRAAEALDKLDRGHMAQVVRAVDAALLEVGDDIFNECAVAALRKAIWMSCLSGHTYTYEVFAERLPICRRDFYKRKSRFLGRVVEYVEACTF